MLLPECIRTGSRVMRLASVYNEASYNCEISMQITELNASMDRENRLMSFGNIVPWISPRSRLSLNLLYRWICYCRVDKQSAMLVFVSLCIASNGHQSDQITALNQKSIHGRINQHKHYFSTEALIVKLVEHVERTQDYCIIRYDNVMIMPFMSLWFQPLE